jgi:hypothetical protein
VEVRLVRELPNLRLTLSDLRTVVNKCSALYPSAVQVRPTIHVGYGARNGDFASVDAILAVVDLPDVIYDCNVTFYGSRSPGSGDMNIIRLAASYPGASLSVAADDEAWVHGVMDVVSALLLRFQYPRPVAPPPETLMLKARGQVASSWRSFLVGTLLGSVCWVAYYRGFAAAYSLGALGWFAGALISLVPVLRSSARARGPALALVVREAEASAPRRDYNLSLLRWTQATVVIGVIAVVVGIIVWRFPVQTPQSTVPPELRSPVRR